ncbi:MAG: glycerate kinase [Thermoleophilia bacterium]
MAILHAGLAAVAPAEATRRALLEALEQTGASEGFSFPARLPGAGGRILVLGAGKAAFSMLEGALEALQAALGEEALERVKGLLVGPPGVSERAGKVRLVAGGHPLPDERGAEAARGMLDLAEEAEEADLVVILLSGGASALMSLPAPGLSLEDLRVASDALLASGAPIEEVNAVRKHLSSISGGRLGVACGPAPTLVMVVSDVVGDRLSAIGSGPACGDPSSFGEALEIVRRRGLARRVPRAVVALLEAGSRGEVPETPDPDDPRLAHVRHFIVARNLDACRAMAQAAEERGYRAMILSHTLEGEARELGVVHAGLALSVVGDGVPLPAPCALVSGGEATVTLRGQGRGGRNQETVLAAAKRLAGLPATFLSAGTDGVDGPTEAAGGVVDGATAFEAARLGVDLDSALDENDSGSALAALGALVETGPTGTNVADVRLLLIGEGAA